MKRPPDMQRLEEILRSSKIVHGGFLGDDRRPLEQILEADAAELERLGRSREELAERMRVITELAKAGLETSVRITDNLDARVLDSRGVLICPWPGEGRFTKTVVEATRRDTGKTVKWSELNIHMIAEHGFFEGKGSDFRIEPQDLVDVIFA